jgi:hypothetical protein
MVRMAQVEMLTTVFKWAVITSIVLAVVALTITATVRADACGASDEAQIPFTALACDTDMTDWTEYAANPVFGEGLDNGPQAYYPSVLYSPTAFDGHGDEAYYKMWFGTSGGKTGYAISDDGLHWITVTVPLNDVNGYHAHVLYEADQFGGHGDAVYYKMWYWDVSNSINYATSNDGLNWTDHVGNPVITNVLGWGSAPVYDANVIYNSDGNPAYYEAWIDNNGRFYYITSDDGMAWTGDNEELLTDRADWEASTYSRASVLKRDGVYHMWYGGSSSGGGNHGIGYAVSTDGRNWVKSPDNPLFHKDDGPAWRDNRTYTPRVLYSATRFDGHGSPEHYKMWFTGKDEAFGDYTIGYATLNPVSLSLADTSGSGQEGAAGNALVRPFFVGLRDTCGDPAGGVTVTFALSGAPAGASGQSLSALAGASDAFGQIPSTLTLGSKPGVYTVTANATGVFSMPAVFTATASHGLASAVSLVPDPRTVVAGDSVTYTVTATDTYGNSWDATSAATYAITPGAGGSWAANVYTSHVAGTWAVSATVDSATVTAALTVEPGPVTRFTFDFIANQVAEAPFSITLTARDACSNTVTGFAGTATLTDTTGVISPTVTGDFVDGVWSGLVRIVVPANDVVITATSGAVSGLSNPFNIAALEPSRSYVYLPLVVQNY